VPSGAEGKVPMCYDDETLAMLAVERRKIVHCALLRGDADRMAAHRGQD
jgi:hypothetical protein